MSGATSLRYLDPYCTCSTWTIADENQERIGDWRLIGEVEFLPEVGLKDWSGCWGKRADGVLGEIDQWKGEFGK
jgi:hypothetical protein